MQVGNMPRRTSLKSVEAQIRKLQAKAEAIGKADKPGVAQAKAVIAKYKLKPADIKLAMNGTMKRVARSSTSNGTKVKPKFRNPDNKSETWAGRGLKPKWLTALLKHGKK